MSTRVAPARPVPDRRLPGALSRTDAQRLAGEWTLSVVYSGERTTSDANSLHRATSRRSCCLPDTKVEPLTAGERPPRSGVQLQIGHLQQVFASGPTADAARLRPRCAPFAPRKTTEECDLQADLVDGSDGTRTRDLRRDRPSPAQRRPTTNASEQPHLQVLLAPTSARLRMVERNIQSMFGPRLGRTNLSQETTSSFGGPSCRRAKLSASLPGIPVRSAPKRLPLRVAGAGRTAPPPLLPRPIGRASFSSQGSAARPRRSRSP